MPEIVTEFLDWYLAPWRRIGRKEFGIALTLATVPGLLIMLLGWGNSAGSFLEPLTALGGLGGAMSGDPQAMEELMRQAGSLSGGSAAPATAPGIDWSAVVNGLCLLALVPLVRMRLRDMGWYGKQEMLLTAALNISVVEGLILSLTGVDVLPMGSLWGFLNFAGYLWLSFAKSKARTPMHERVAEPWKTPENKDDTDGY